MNTGTSLPELLKHSLQKSTSQFGHGCHRLVVGGVPSGTLEDLFRILTGGDGSPWQVSDLLQMPVFLIKREPNANGAGVSRECNWDYALAIRNSYPSFLLLVDPDVWDDRTYSIINATETISLPLPPIRRSPPNLRRWSAFYAELVEMAAVEIGIDTSIVELAMRQVLMDLPQLDPEAQHLLPWQVLDKIAALANRDSVARHDDLAKVCGLLPSASDTCDFDRSRAILERPS